MPKVKIAIIGGGSYSWTFTIVRDLIVTGDLEGSTIVLEDIDPETLKVTGPLCRKIVKKSRQHWKRLWLSNSESWRPQRWRRVMQKTAGWS